MTSHQQALAALDHVQVGILVLDADLAITFLNRAQLEWLRRLGVERRPHEVIGTPAAVSFPIFSKDEWDGMLARTVTAAEPVRWTKLPCPRMNPTSYAAIDLIPLAGDNGGRPGLLCLTEDVTRGVALDRELIEKARLALVGQAGVALVHEISNPLAAILGAAEALLFSASLGPDVARRVESIKVNAVKVAEITRTLRELEDLQLSEYLQGGPVYVTAEKRSS